MIEALAKKDKHWRDVAYKISGDKTLADDIVNDMYIRVYDQQPAKISDGYIYTIMRNLFIDQARSRSKISFTDFSNIEVQEQEQTIYPDIEPILQTLTWYERTIFKHAVEIGQREFSRRTDIHIQTIHRVTNSVKKKIWQRIEKNKDLEM